MRDSRNKPLDRQKVIDASKYSLSFVATLPTSLVGQRAMKCLRNGIAHVTKRNRTTTSLSLAAIILSLGIEPISGEAQQASETPGVSASVSSSGGGAGSPPVGGGGGEVVPDKVDSTNDVIVGDGGSNPPTFVGPPGSNYTFTQPPPADYVFQQPGSPRCQGGGGIPFCRDSEKDCCPDPNTPNQYVCCIPTTDAS